MSELEKLYEQKRQIEEQIKALKSEVYKTVGCLKYEKKEVSDDGRNFVVSIEMMQRHCRYESYESAKLAGRDFGSRKLLTDREVLRWQSFIREKSKEDTVKKIKSTIIDMIDLLKALGENTGFYFEDLSDMEANI